MATQVQFRGGTTSQHGSFTGAVREVTVDTDKETLVVHDGSTAGGFPMARANGIGVANFTITTADNTDQLTLVSTDADANVGPSLNLYRNSGSPADSDLAGIVNFTSRNDNSQDFIVASLDASVIDVSDGTEDGRFRIKTMTAGTLKTVSFVAGNITVSDGQEVRFGNAADLRISHDGSNSFIRDEGTGNLYLDSVVGNFYVRVNDTENAIEAVQNGAVTLYHNNVAKIATASSGVTVTGGVTTTTASSIEGGAVFNESSADVDFRVESNTLTHALFVDGASGDVLVGKSASDNTTVGVRIQANGFASFVRDGSFPLLLNRKSSDGTILDLRKENSTVGTIGSASSKLHIASVGNSGIRFRNDLNCYTPCNADGSNSDNDQNIGQAAVRYGTIFATSSSINTSDKNEKQDIEELTDAEKRVAVVAKGLIRKYRWKDAVALKGDKARIHFGIMAQDLQDVFTAESLDASRYGMFCSDTWWEKEISVDAVEADEENDIEAQDAYTYIDDKQEATEGYTEKTRLGVRYSELLAFIISAI